MKKLAKITALIIVAALLFLSSCDKSGNNDDNDVLLTGEYNLFHEVNIPNDKYRTFYQIFVGSFFDSNGNGKGDLNGITQKLDYLNDGDYTTYDDLGITGIWLTPINTSPSYHKYDVTDYYSIDPAFGTMADFENLLEEAEKRGIKVIIDLVLNHTSNNHPWYQNAVLSITGQNTSPNLVKYRDYYNFSNQMEYGYRHLTGNIYVEAVFGPQMPDLNLDNAEVRQHISDIAAFWLNKGVAGFRLDATTHFYEGNNTKNAEFLNWFATQCRAVNPDVYIIGEAWTSAGSIAQLYSSGIDSFFNFPSGGSSGRISGAIRFADYPGYSGNDFASYLQNWQQTITNKTSNAIDAPFLSNHDMARSSAYFLNETVKMKMAANIYLMMPGNPFIYYGEELGLKGGTRDQDFRTSMLWSITDKTGETDWPAGASKFTQINTSVESQLIQDNSLLRHYMRAIRIRNENPEIARGTVSAIQIDGNFCFYKTEYEDSAVYIIHNITEEQQKIFLPKSNYNYSGIRGYLTDNNTIPRLSGDYLIMPAYSTVILK